jgi:hypothetical protein
MVYLLGFNIPCVSRECGNSRGNTAQCGNYAFHNLDRKSRHKSACSRGANCGPTPAFRRRSAPHRDHGSLYQRHQNRPDLGAERSPGSRCWAGPVGRSRRSRCRASARHGVMRRTIACPCRFGTPQPIPTRGMCPHARTRPALLVRWRSRPPRTVRLRGMRATPDQAAGTPQPRPLHGVPGVPPAGHAPVPSSCPCPGRLITRPAQRLGIQLPLRQAAPDRIKIAQILRAESGHLQRLVGLLAPIDGLLLAAVALLGGIFSR